jgi:hypothetical protein
VALSPPVPPVPPEQSPSAELQIQKPPVHEHVSSTIVSVGAEHVSEKSQDSPSCSQVPQLSPIVWFEPQPGSVGKEGQPVVVVDDLSSSSSLQAMTSTKASETAAAEVTNLPIDQFPLAVLRIANSSVSGDRSTTRSADRIL